MASKNGGRMAVRILAALGVILALGSGCIGVQAEEGSFDLCGREKRTTCVVDGDTFWFEGEKYRIANIDTPEIASATCVAELGIGVRATQRLMKLLNQGAFNITRQAKSEAFGRTLATIQNSAGEDIGEIMISEGIARPWAGRRENWC
ncbi:thermonuclease family protein [Devosia sp. MC521]|uniref:thermonuclease family protein n=1 Tax=Devosia sp. MC521 TaxID=2759954 RepID=UPI0015FBA97C|nr:thermonuclease family protein [Devosia sp. MC521]MBJ6985916.1 thermonuclease family protein [Devosia sp. MC521]QMW61293.1 thermonuclease family protein [Devosia sp. MC521]